LGDKDEAFAWLEEAVFAHAVGRSADVRDAPAALGDEMFCGLLAHMVIVYAHKVGIEAAEPAVDQDQGHAGVADSAQLLAVFLARCQHQAVEMVGKHVLDLVLFKPGIAFR